MGMLLHVRTTRSSRVAPRERNSIRAVAHVDQWIVGLLNSVDELARQKPQCLLHLRTIRHYFVDCQHAECRDLAVFGPEFRGVLRGIARGSKLRLEMECYWPLLQTLRQ